MGNEHITKQEFKDFEGRQDKRLVRIETDLEAISAKVIDHREADVLHEKFKYAMEEIQGMKLDYNKQIAEIKLHFTTELNTFSSVLNDKFQNNRTEIAKLVTKVSVGAAILIPIATFLLNRYL